MRVLILLLVLCSGCSQGLVSCEVQCVDEYGGPVHDAILEVTESSGPSYYIYAWTYLDDVRFPNHGPSNVFPPRIGIDKGTTIRVHAVTAFRPGGQVVVGVFRPRQMEIRMLRFPPPPPPPDRRP